MPCFSMSAMKSAGVKRASADFAKCGFAEIKFSGRQWMFVKLHRPPPEIRIFLPRRSACSITATRRPRLPASMAHISPAAPPPMTIASNVWLTSSHVEKAQARQAILFQQALIHVLLVQLFDLRPGHLSAIGGKIAIGIGANGH